MSWERARQPEQIEARRRSIIDAADALFDEVGFEAASLSAIARRAGVSKAAIYRYFESREEIFMRLAGDGLQAWTEAIEAKLARLAGSDDLDALSDALVDTVLERPRLAALLARLPSVLEHNVSAETIRELKRQMSALSLRMLNAMHAAAPALDLGATHRFLLHFFVFGGGLQPYADPPEAVAQVMAEPEFEALCIDYEGSLRDHTRLMLRGLAAEN